MLINRLGKYRYLKEIDSSIVLVRTSRCLDFQEIFFKTCVTLRFHMLHVILNEKCHTIRCFCINRMPPHFVAVNESVTICVFVDAAKKDAFHFLFVQQDAAASS